MALKLVVDREKEIEAFKPVEYWNLAAILKTPEDERYFRAPLFCRWKKVEKEPIEGKNIYSLGNKEAADAILARMKNTALSGAKR